MNRRGCLRQPSLRFVCAGPLLSFPCAVSCRVAPPRRLTWTRYTMRAPQPCGAAPFAPLPFALCRRPVAPALPSSRRRAASRASDAFRKLYPRVDRLGHWARSDASIMPCLRRHRALSASCLHKLNRPLRSSPTSPTLTTTSVAPHSPLGAQCRRLPSMRPAAPRHLVAIAMTQVASNLLPPLPGFYHRVHLKP
jgi:hypothetical protein